MDGVKHTVMQWKVREKELQSKVLVLRRFAAKNHSIFTFQTNTKLI